MNLIQAFILGVVEGLTEFLPVSSTAHLVITAKLLGLQQSDFLSFFEIFIQIGAIFAIVFLYFKKLRENLYLINLLAVSFIPTAILGLLLHKLLKTFLLGNILVIAFSLIGVGILFLLDKSRSEGKKLGDMTLKEAFMIGIIQSMAVVPGVSRSGAVILGMLYMGYRRDIAAEYSFLLGLPTLSAAAFYDAFKSKIWTFDTTQLDAVLVATFTAFIVAVVAVRWFITYLQKKSLKEFGLYRILLGVGLLFWIFR